MTRTRRRTSRTRRAQRRAQGQSEANPRPERGTPRGVARPCQLGSGDRQVATRPDEHPESRKALGQGAQEWDCKHAEPLWTGLVKRQFTQPTTGDNYSYRLAA
jgi:hypothetical protein